jgi:HD-GYP domain-containing protein (c-di-GMP phosphodiesterase class II)
MLHDAPELKKAAEIIKFHHTFWNERNEAHMSKYNIPLASHILHLADRIDILINRNEEILKQRGFISSVVEAQKGIMFMPEAVEAFDNLMERTFFWFDIVNPYLENIIREIMLPYMVHIDSSSFVNFSNIAHRIIDFRSQFTATHSTGVATSAKALSIKMGFDTSDSEWMYCAGLMHDLGKLCISENILEKNGSLDSEEFNLIKSHPYHTYRILNSIPGLEKVRDWAAFHHEKLDGKGYPFNKKDSDLDLGSRILAVSDIFTALAEDRPYREAMPLEMALNTVNNIKNLDYDVKAYLNNNIEEINQARKLSQESAIINCTEMLKSERNI